VLRSKALAPGGSWASTIARFHSSIALGRSEPLAQAPVPMNETKSIAFAQAAAPGLSAGNKTYAYRNQVLVLLLIRRLSRLRVLGPLQSASGILVRWIAFEHFFEIAFCIGILSLRPVPLPPVVVALKIARQ